MFVAFLSRDILYYDVSMIFIALFTIELLLLFLSSRVLTGLISKLIFSLSKNKIGTVYFLSFLFLPGVIIHELSHFLIASILLVRCKDMEFTPKIHGNTVKLGSVQVEKTDFIRSAVIAFAPTIIGCSIITAVLLYFTPGIFNLSKISVWQTLIFLYVLFQIGNTMFVSRKDIEAALKFLLVLSSLLIILYLFNIKILEYFFEFLQKNNTQSFFKELDLFFLVPLFINFSFILAFKSIIRLSYYKLYFLL